MEVVKIYLDDVRPCPKGWILAKTAWECIDLLELHHGFPIILSLDHDLGPEEAGTGYDVITHIEEKMYYDKHGTYVKPIQITVHSANPVGAARMRAGIEAIYKMKFE